MKLVFSIITVSILCFSGIGHAGEHAKPSHIADPVTVSDRFSVALKLSSKLSSDSGLLISGFLTIRNKSEDQIVIESPGNRMALVFFVTDQYGNPVQPDFLGKVNPRYSKLTLKKNETYEHKIEKLRFISGTAHLEYKLKNLEYRVFAVYYPMTSVNPGIPSNEVRINKPEKVELK